MEQLPRTIFYQIDVCNCCHSSASYLSEIPRNPAEVGYGGGGL